MSRVETIVGVVTLLGLTLLIRALSGHDDPAPTTTEPVRSQWVRLRAGTFMMGSPQDEVGRDESRESLRRVTITRDFEILATEMTQGQFEDVMGYNPSRFVACGPACPVDTVTWHEAAAFCNRLSEREGLDRCYACTGSRRETSCEATPGLTSPHDCTGYRLPTEAEWELAARAGSDTATYEGDLEASHLTCEIPNPVHLDIAWVCWNADGEAHPTGALEPNAAGLYDVLGSVWEWCHDGFVEDLGTAPATDPTGPLTAAGRVLRGGAWNSRIRQVRAAFRGRVVPQHTHSGVGFRPARTLLEQQ